jgi:Mrp family chromosome partitioning ATPase
MSNIGKAIDRYVGRQPGDNGSPDRFYGSASQRKFEYEDQVVSKRYEAQKQISRMQQPRLFSQKELRRLRFVTSDLYKDEMRHPFSMVRNRVTHNHAAKGGTVLVTSVVPDYGASVFCRNLAATIAQDESCTSLLLECKTTGDMLHLAENKQAPGLTDYIVDESLFVQDVIYPSGIERMRIIPFGNSGSATLDFLRSTRMRVLVKDVTRRYRERFTVIDAPSVIKASDVELLNDYADQIILLVPYGKVTERQIAQSIGRFDREKFLGTVFVDLPPIPGFLSGIF